MTDSESIGVDKLEARRSLARLTILAIFGVLASFVSFWVYVIAFGLLLNVGINYWDLPTSIIPFSPGPRWPPSLAIPLYFASSISAVVAVTVVIIFPIKYATGTRSLFIVAIAYFWIFLSVTRMLFKLFFGAYGVLIPNEHTDMFLTPDHYQNIASGLPVFVAPFITFYLLKKFTK